MILILPIQKAMADQVNQLLLADGVAFLEYAGYQLAFKEYISKGFWLDSGDAWVSTHRTVIFIRDSNKLTQHQAAACYSQHYSEKKIIRQHVDVSRVLHIDWLNPNKKERTISELTTHMNDDVASIIAGYIDGRE